MSFEVYYSVGEVATRLAMSVKTVKRWCERGELGTVYRLVGELRVTESGVTAFLERNREDYDSLAVQAAKRALVERMRPPSRDALSSGICARSEGELRRKSVRTSGLEVSDE